MLLDSETGGQAKGLTGMVYANGGRREDADRFPAEEVDG